MKKVKFGAAVLAFALAAAVVFAGGSGDKKAAGSAAGAAPKTVTWKLAFNQSIEHPQAQALLWLSDEFSKATNGAYKIDVNPNELLGSQAQSFESLRAGAIQMAMLGNPVVEAVIPDFAVIALPGLYPSPEQQVKVFTSGVLKPLFDKSGQFDFYVIAAVHAGVRNVYAKKPVRSPADIKGMKIRVMQSQLMLDTMNAVGASAVAMGQGEVYTGIQQGVLDGAENSEVTFYDLKQYEVAPIYSYTRHFMIPDVLVINKDTYAALSAQHKAIFDKLIVEFSARASANFIAQVTTAKQKAKDAGATFIEDVDAAAFQAGFAPVIQKNLNSDFRKQLFDAIRAVK